MSQDNKPTSETNLNRQTTKRSALKPYAIDPKWKLMQDVLGFRNSLNLYPPYLGAGIQVDEFSDNPPLVKVSMDLNAFNTNYVGVHFGGSLYSMCDPFFMFILMRHLGQDFIVWDKKATIEFLRPGASKVFADFTISLAEIEKIRQTAVKNRKTDWEFEASIHDVDGQRVAKVIKTLYIRHQATR